MWKEITMPKTKEAPAPKAEKAAVISTLPQDQIAARAYLRLAEAHKRFLGRNN